MTSDAKKKPPAVVGATYDATTSGFVTMIAEANARLAEGYQLLSIFKLDKKLAAVFVHHKAKPLTTTEPYADFVGEDDEDPILNYR